MFSKTGITDFGRATDLVPMHSQPLKILAEGVKCEVALLAHRSTGLKQRTVPYRDTISQMNCWRAARSQIARSEFFLFSEEIFDFQLRYVQLKAS